MTFGSRLALVNAALATTAVALGCQGLIPHVAGRTGMVGAALLSATLVAPAVASALSAPPRWLRGVAEARRGLGLSSLAWILAHVIVCVALKLAVDASLLRQLFSREVALGVGALVGIVAVTMASRGTARRVGPHQGSALVWALPVPILTHGLLAKAFFDSDVPVTSTTLLALAPVVALWHLLAGLPRGRAKLALVLVGAMVAVAVLVAWPDWLTMQRVAPHLGARH